MMNKVPKIWINGELMSADEVRVSPFDLGLTVGLGVFETMLAYGGHVFAYPKHHERLVQAARLMRLQVPTMEVIGAAMLEVIRSNDLQAENARARVRVSVSGGVNPLQGGDITGNVMVTAVSQPEPAKEAVLVLGIHRCDEGSALVGMKSASYASHVLNLRHAVEAGGDEALVLNTRGFVSECSMSNIFLVKDGVVKTPSLSSGCLSGVTRALVIELCQEHDIPVDEVELEVTDVQDADEIFITSSAREVQAARLLDKKGGGVGPVTGRLAGEYKALIKRESGRGEKR